MGMFKALLNESVSEKKNWLDSIDWIMNFVGRGEKKDIYEKENIVFISQPFREYLFSQWN